MMRSEDSRTEARARRLRAVFSPERVRYWNFPAACPREAYEQTVERYVDRVSRVPKVLGIGRFGNISAPGISDLDLVVVTEGALPAGQAGALSIVGLPAFDQNLFMHEPAVLPADGMSHVREHLNVSAIDTVWGAVPAPPTPPEEERRWQEMAILIEWLGCFSRFFGEIACLGVCNARWALPVLHSIRYSVQIAEALVADAPDSWTLYPESVAALRSEWFALPSDAARAERLAECLAEGWEITADLCWRVDRWIEEKNLLPSAHTGWSVYSYEPARFAIVARSKSAEAAIDSVLDYALPVGAEAPRRWKRISSRIAPSWCLLPRFHEAFVRAAAASAPTLHAQNSARWFGGRRIAPMEPSGPFERYLCERMARLDERMASYLESSGLGFGSACSDLIYAPPDPERTRASWRRRLLLAAQKTWGTGRARALARRTDPRYSFC